jgi:hypothetical protein
MVDTFLKDLNKQIGRQTRSNGFESLLDFRDKKSDWSWRPSPEDETVSRINITWFKTWIFQSLKDAIQNHSFEIRAEQSGFLLRITCGAVGCIAGLDFSLHTLAVLLRNLELKKE